MRYLFISTLLVLIIANISHAFEIDGFKSGMSMRDAQKQLERYSYKNIKVEGNNISAYYQMAESPRLFNLNFCKGSLVQVQKELEPRFDHFVRLIDERRRVLGRPFDVWVRPSDATASIEKNSITFVWKNDKTLIQISYTEFLSSRFVDITYEINNACWKILH